jgi:hypothetical protein
MLTPVALKTILPDAQRNALKHWLISNDMSFIAGTLLGSEGINTAEKPSDLLNVLKGMDYSESFKELQNSAQEVTGSLGAGMDTDAGKNYFETVGESVGTTTSNTSYPYPASEWFPDYHFSERTKVYSVQDTGCVHNKQISMNAGSCTR